MSRTTRALLCLAVALPMSIGASATLAQSPQPYPLDTQIALTEMAGTAVAPDAGITITFAADATLSGFGGCNDYSASWQSDGATLTVGPIAATRKACAPAVDALETQYLGLLQSAASWTLNGSAVGVVTSDGSTLTYGGDAAGSAIVGEWQLSTVGGAPVPAVITATAVFGADGTLTGSGGCNTFTGTYTVDGAALSVGPLAATRTFCDAAAQLESAYLDALQGATGWVVDASTLTITGTSTLVFTSDATSDATLTGQPWALVTMGGQTVDPSLGTSATFAEDGTVAGSGGCNQYSATYTTDGDNLAVGPVAATRKTCAPHVNESESAFFAALESATAFEISGADLVIGSSDGSAMDFQVQAGPPPSPAATTERTTEPSAEPTAAATAGGSPVATDAIVGSWKMTELMGTALPASFLKITVDLAADGTLTGNGGCNGYSATWTLSGTTFTLGGLATDSGATCDATTQGIEQSYFSVLPYIDTAQITDGKLVLGSSLASSISFTFEPAN